MDDKDGRAAFRALPRAEQEKLYLDILETPPFDHKGSWGEWLHAWLEDQSAEGRPLGEIARRMDFPTYQDSSVDDPWVFLERHVCWLIERGYVRVVRIEAVT
jgi:hypothetical protein